MNEFLGLKLRLNRNSRNYDDYVRRLNEIPNMSWVAGNYMEFEGMSLEELNRYTGMKNTGKK